MLAARQNSAGSQSVLNAGRIVRSAKDPENWRILAAKGAMGGSSFRSPTTKTVRVAVVVMGIITLSGVNYHHARYSRDWFAIFDVVDGGS